MSDTGDKLRRAWDAADRIVESGPKGPLTLRDVVTSEPQAAEVLARRLDGSQLTLSVREVKGIRRRLAAGTTTPEVEAAVYNVRPRVIELLQKGQIFANLPEELKVFTPGDLTTEGIEVHELWASSKWKGG